MCLQLYHRTMKKYFLLPIISLTILSLLSWGYKGHRAVALIAQNHLTIQSKGAIADLLNGKSIEDASTWADDIKSNPKYRNTSSWHFLNLPSGLRYKRFENAIVLQTNDNLYSALVKAQATLKQPDATKAEKQEALKFLIHLVGDAHQPMHISRAEDKGGNAIQVRFDNKGTNLHTLWDSKLLDHEGLTDVEMSIDYDKATPAQIKQWQSDDLMKWLWESYQVSSKIYTGVSPGSKLDEDYYKTNMKTVQERVQVAGIRLAGLLNELLKDYKPSADSYLDPKVVVSKDGLYADIGGVKAIKTHDAIKFVGSAVVLSDKVYSVRDMGSFVLVNLGGEYPNQLLTVVLRSEARQLKNSLTGKTITVVGTVTDYNGKPQIEVKDLMAVNVLGDSK